MSVNWAGEGKVLTINSGGTHAGFQGREARAEVAGTQGPSPCTGRVGLEFACVWGRPSGWFQIQTTLNHISVRISKLLYNTHTFRQESKWGRKQRGSKTRVSYQALLVSQARHSQQYIHPSLPRWAGGAACAGHASWIKACVQLAQSHPQLTKSVLRSDSEDVHCQSSTLPQQMRSWWWLILPTLHRETLQWT